MCQSRNAAKVPIQRVFDIDVERCPHCGGDLKIIAAIEEPAVIVKILTHPGLPARAPPRSPARPLALFRAGPDPQGKYGSETGPTIRLGPHSRTRSNVATHKRLRSLLMLRP